uniref:Uncharacterized protein n=1 Tax=Oryza nivara TaxID=4536 RepID=A0A0E0FFL8_ORYNI
MQIVHNLLVSYDNYPSTGQQLRITRCGGGGVKKWKAVTSIKLREFEKEMGREWEKRGEEMEKKSGRRGAMASGYRSVATLFLS